MIVFSGSPTAQSSHVRHAPAVVQAIENFREEWQAMRKWFVKGEDSPRNNAKANTSAGNKVRDAAAAGSFSDRRP